MKKSFIYLSAFILLTGIEVLIALYVHDNIIRPYIGDVLIMVVLYCLLRSFVPNGMPRLPLYLFFTGIAAEVLQYFDLVKVLGLQDNRFMRVLIGSTFDLKDIACYGAGCLIIMLMEKSMKGRGRK